MNIRKSMLIVGMGLIMSSACADKKSKEVKVDASSVEKSKTEINKEASEKEGDLKAAKQRVTDSLRKVDSIEQVKNHGHAH